MMALIFKEIRESARWAALFALMLLGVLAWAIGEELDQGFSLLGLRMEMVSAFAFPIIGLALGLLAVLPDARKGRWQFVVHRPISRSKVFAAKAVGTALLYLLASLVPLLAVYAWVATPGHVPGPVTFDMLLPRLADLSGGLLWCAAGLLIAARSARWIGSRLMPLGFAFFVTLAAVFLSIRFVEYELAIGGGTIVLLTAAHRAFVSGGELPRRAWIARVCAGLAIVAGWLLIVGVAVVFLNAIPSVLFHVQFAATDFKYYTIRNDGRILIAGANGDRDVTDLEGRPASLAAPDLDPGVPMTSLSLADDLLSATSFAGRVSEWGFHLPRRHLQLLYSVPDYDQINWFYVVSRNTVEGFNVTRRQFVSSLSSKGWSATPQPFPEQLNRVGNLSEHSQTNNGTVVVGDRTVWGLNLAPPGTSTLFAAESGDRVLDAAQFFDARAEPASPPPLITAVLTQRAIYVLRDRKPAVRIPVDEHSAAYNSVQVGETSDGRLVLDYQPRWELDPIAPQMVEIADAAGKILSRVELPDLNSREFVRPWTEEALFAIPMPPVIGFWEVGKHLFVRQQKWMIQPLVSTAVGVLLILITIPLARRRQFSAWSIVGWAVLDLLIGIPGLLVLISMDTPVPTVTCDSCGRKRPISREDCPHCAAGFAPPAKTGIEVFATA